MNFLARLSLQDGKLADGAVPYVLLRVDSLIGMFQRLDADARCQAVDAFAESVFEHGGHSIGRYQRETQADTNTLIALLARTAPQLGWGQWSIRALESENHFEMQVTNSPFTGLSDSSPACAPIAGMFRALVTQCAGQDMQVAEVECVAQGAELCRFRAAPA